VKPTLLKAGRFPITQRPCPHLGAHVVTTAPRAAVLHTTEGSWSSSLGEFKKKWAPHFLLGLNDATKNVEISQLVPIGFIGASLEAHNDHAIVQIEMIGFSKEQPWLPNPETVDALASLMLVIRDSYGVPLSRPYADGNFGRYGYHNGHRDKFGKVAGWFGHADVPDNAHWDPGNLEFSKVFARALALDLPAPTKGATA
jgi:hypothetical protein